MHPQEFGAAHLFHSSTTDGQWVGVLGVVSPEVDDNLLFLHIEKEIVIYAPRGQLVHLPPVVGLTAVADETYHGCVILKLDEEVGAVAGCAVVGQQG